MKEALRRLDGLFVGLLDEGDLELFNWGVNHGHCMRVYEGAGGFMGLAKVKVLS